MERNQQCKYGNQIRVGNDLYVNSVSNPPATGVKGSPIPLSCNIYNVGNIIPNTVVTVEFLLSTDNKYDPYIDTELGSVTYNGLPSGVSVTKYATLNIPSN